MDEEPKFDFGETVQITGKEHKGRIGVGRGNQRTRMLPNLHGRVRGRERL